MENRDTPSGYAAPYATNCNPLALFQEYLRQNISTENDSML